MIVIAIRINIDNSRTSKRVETSRAKTRKGRKEVTTEERIRKANGGGWNWKWWRQEGRIQKANGGGWNWKQRRQEDGIGSRRYRLCESLV
jgi:hypothetical protein